jgi:hypothetical protein
MTLSRSGIPQYWQMANRATSELALPEIAMGVIDGD